MQLETRLTTGYWIIKEKALFGKDLDGICVLSSHSVRRWLVF